jgi:hypothetical protein
VSLKGHLLRFDKAWLEERNSCELHAARGFNECNADEG